MARKRATANGDSSVATQDPPGQKQFEGDEWPEKTPPAVEKACRNLRQAIKDKTEATNAEKAARLTVKEKLQEAELTRVKVDDKVYELDDEVKVKVKAVKGDEDDD